MLEATKQGVAGSRGDLIERQGPPRIRLCRNWTKEAAKRHAASVKRRVIKKELGGVGWREDGTNFINDFGENFFGRN